MDTRVRGNARRAVVAVWLVSAAAITGSATAAADEPIYPAPAPPAGPAAPTPPQTLGPLATVPAGGYGMDLTLGQYAVPALPGQPAAAGYTPDVLNAANFLLPQNYRVPGEDQTSPYELQEGVPPGPFARIDALKGAHAVIHGALGRMPIEDLSQPLPGTAPQPGMTLPPGPEQNLPIPALPPA
jgi:hypothetical protein